VSDQAGAAPAAGGRIGWFRFEAVDADDYERYRPGYASEAIDWLMERAGLGPSSVVIDLGAGTGKLARSFVGRVGQVIAVEPAPNMLAVLRESVPHARAVAGTAEAIPLPEASVDCAVAGQAFHHFDGPVALRDVHRVLRPGGHFALLWNMPDPNDPLDGALDAIIDRHVGASPIHVAFDSWRDAFREAPLFLEVGEEYVTHIQETPSTTLAPAMATSSDVASLPEHGRNELLAEVEEFARNLPERIAITRRTEVHLFRRLD